jgi:cyanophycinase-like exopeptidase
MKKKLGSRKFLVTLAGVLTVIANDYFGFGLDKDTVFGIVSMVAAYVLGQGYVDAKKGGE